MNASSVRTFSAVALAVAAACAYCLPASAGDKENCGHAKLTHDVEGNGQLTATSHKTGAAKRFEMMDTNRDGKLTAAEIGGSRGAESIAWANEQTPAFAKITAFDTDKDGALSAKEYADGSQRMFDKLDADGDGELSATEMHVSSKMTAR